MISNSQIDYSALEKGLLQSNIAQVVVDVVRYEMFGYILNEFSKLLYYKVNIFFKDTFFLLVFDS